MNVDPIARWYRWIEYAAFGRTLERARFAFTGALKGARRILVLGEGDGRGLLRMLQVCPQAHFDVVELSAQMIGLAKRRTGGSPRVSFHQQNVMETSWKPNTYDAVVTHFFLDCLTEAEVQKLIARMKPALLPHGMWLISDFTIPRRGWRHWWAALWVAAMYRFFRVTTGLRAQQLGPFEEMLQAAGLRETRRQTRFGGMVVSALWVLK